MSTVWRIQTPAGYTVPAMEDADPDALVARYAKLMGSTWETLRKRGYARVPCAVPDEEPE